jgi:hypothetical protein
MNSEKIKLLIFNLNVHENRLRAMQGRIATKVLRQIRSGLFHRKYARIYEAKFS